MEGLKCIGILLGLIGVYSLLVYFLERSMANSVWNGGQVRRKVFSRSFDLIKALRKSEISTDTPVYFSIVAERYVLLEGTPDCSDMTVELVVLNPDDLGLGDQIYFYSELESAVHQLGYLACPPDIAAMVALKKPDCNEKQYIVFTQLLDLEKIAGFPQGPALFIIRKSIDFSVNLETITEPFEIGEDIRFVVMKRR